MTIYEEAAKCLGLAARDYQRMSADLYDYLTEIDTMETTGEDCPSWIAALAIATWRRLNPGERPLP